MGQHQKVRGGGEYRSVFSDWDTKAAVRCRPRRMLHELEDGLVPFSTALAPIASHPLVMDRGRCTVQEILTRRLYLHLDFTTVLEQDFVNPVLLEIARGCGGGVFPAEMRLDAYRIYCDEAYHALFSVDLSLQVQAATGIARRAADYEPHFARLLRGIRKSVPRDLRPAVDMCFVIVSETLISGVLSGIPLDGSVLTAVRDSIADHAFDERRHHAYFAKVLDRFWPQLGCAEQRLIAPLFGRFILAFLDPDRVAQEELLRDAGFTAEESSLIIRDSHPSESVVTAARRAARSTLHLLERAGVLSDERIVDKYRTLGLISD